MSYNGHRSWAYAARRGGKVAAAQAMFDTLVEVTGQRKPVTPDGAEYSPARILAANGRNGIMPKFVVTVEDRITLVRRVEVVIDAATIRDAEEQALRGADAAMANGPVHSEQIDNDPYEVVACRRHRGFEPPC